MKCCTEKHIDTTEYLETRRKAPGEIGKRISRQKTQFLDVGFDRPNIKILKDEQKNVTHYDLGLIVGT